MLLNFNLSRNNFFLNNWTKVYSINQKINHITKQTHAIAYTGEGHGALNPTLNKKNLFLPGGFRHLRVLNTPGNEKNLRPSLEKFLCTALILFLNNYSCFYHDN